MISIVVPAFNEKENIHELLSRISLSLGSRNIPYEIIVIDDHSTDGTWELLEQEQNNFPLKIYRKLGKKGKAYSLIEGFSQASGDILAMIDADLQYPPEAIGQMAEALGDCDIVIANRSKYKTPAARKYLSYTFRYLFGRLLFQIGCDVQSGLKVFNREVFEGTKFTPRSAWVFDLEFLIRAKEAGFRPKIYDINFIPRRNGQSKINSVRNGLELVLDALLLKFKAIPPVNVAPDGDNMLRGASLRFKGQRYLTHTTLNHKKSAVVNFSSGQKIALFSALSVISAGFYAKSFTLLISAIALLSIFYFLDVIFNLLLVLKSLSNPPEIKISESELAGIQDESLPFYSILCPLYKEGNIVCNFVEAVKKLDWPKDKLEVLLLLEKDDLDTQSAIKRIDLPKYIRTVIVPHSSPKTKPKACNFGLSMVRGQYLVIYDAEDMPESSQLKKAYLAFGQVPENVICLQAKLNFFNPYQNLLTKIFTAEYSLWFDVILPGLQSIQTAIPLGGTSNHFKTSYLLGLEGWDPFNVTEDADLGIRLFNSGFRTAIFDSTTYEEANSKVGNWFRQRSRWIKGYMQTYLVQMRNPIDFIKANGLHALIFQLVIGGKIASMFINPFLWLATISYFAINSLVGPAIEALYPAPIFYMAVFSLVFGNFLFVYYYMIGCAKRGHWALMRYVFLVPFYWLMMSVAGVVALKQLVLKPHYWEKTVHGYHLPYQTQAAPVKFSAQPPIFAPNNVPIYATDTYMSSGVNPYNAYFARIITDERRKQITRNREYLRPDQSDENLNPAELVNAKSVLN